VAKHSAAPARHNGSPIHRQLDGDLRRGKRNGVVRTIDLTCGHCERVFTVRIAARDQKYCSRSCGVAATRNGAKNFADRVAPLGAGYRCGSLVVLSEEIRGRHRVALCRCDCGVTKEVSADAIRAGRQRSCGCARTVHGMSGTPEYRTWANLIDRCTNPCSKSYDRYGGRGIRVCDRWRASFEAFLADVGPRPSAKHSIDRYPDNDGHYEPGNVRWATRTEQQRNTSRARLSASQVAEIKRAILSGERDSAIARRYGVGQGSVLSIRRGRSWRDVEPAKESA
jgi:hypothetical protein